MEIAGESRFDCFGNAGGVYVSTDMTVFLILLRRNNPGLAFLRSLGPHFP